MPTASLRSIGISLAFHGMLLGVAGRGVMSEPSRPSRHRVAALDAAILVDAADSSGRPPPAGPHLSTAESPMGRPEPTASRQPREPKARAPRPPVPEPAHPTEVQPRPPVSLATVAPASPTPPEPSAPPTAGGAAPTLSPPGDGAERSSSAASGTGPAADGELGASRATASPSVASAEAAASDGRARLLASYLKSVRARVASHREYPYLARRASLEGTVCLRVVVAASGRVLGVTPTCGMTHEPLLEAALASVSSAAPFPPLPAALGQRLSFDIPVVFQLDRL